jgi:ribosomal-protein-serine acetyltransferase
MIVMELWPASVIKTPRLTLRPWSLADLDQFHDAIVESVEHIRPFLPWAAFEPQSKEQRVALIEEMVAKEHKRVADAVDGISTGDVPYWTFARDESGNERLIGGVGLHHRVGAGGIEIGYWTRLSETNRGYVTEAARGLTTEGFRNPAINVVAIHTDHDNVFSAAVPRGLGYQLVAEDLWPAVTAPRMTVLKRWHMYRNTWEALHS